jgi:dTDP-4-dehydrorhamnose 3,5-epimerase
MELTSLSINGAWLAESPIWSDKRGFFREWFKREEVLSKTGIDFSVQQANVSVSKGGVIRGIHYSLAPEGQAKWITCVEGSILDVVVDLRPESPTFKKHEIVHLKGNDGRALLIGVGLGHGFLSLEDNTYTSYLLSSPYNPAFEYEIQPSDPELNINWNHELMVGLEFIISEKDFQAPSVQERASRGQLPHF